MHSLAAIHPSGWTGWIAFSRVQLVTQAIADQGETGHADDYQCRGHKNQMGMAWEDGKSVLDHHPQLWSSRLHPQSYEAQSAHAEKQAPKAQGDHRYQGGDGVGKYVSSHDVALACPQSTGALDELVFSACCAAPLIYLSILISMPPISLACTSIDRDRIAGGDMICRS